MTDTGLLPWHTQQWRLISKAVQDQRLPHALLLHGPAGLGKAQFKNQLARLLICSRPVEADAVEGLLPCGQCKPCKQFSTEGIHADIFRLEPEEEGKAIKIAHTREAIEFCSLAAHYGGRKLVLIEPAEALNLNAANALLKTLEEPSSNTVLILISHQASKLLATIRSRCLQIRFNKPSKNSALEWLQAKGINDGAALLSEAQGYPVHASKIAEEGGLSWRQARDKELLLFLSENRSVSGLVRLWLNHDLEQLHAWLFDRLRRITWFKSGQNDVLQGSHAELGHLAEAPQLHQLEQILSEINSLKLSNIHNINNQLAMESLLISMANDGSG